MSSLSLLAEFDDLMRHTNVLAESSIEPEFLRFALHQEEVRKKWQVAVEETRRLQGELEKATKDISMLEGKLFHSRVIIDKERSKHIEVERRVTELEKKLALVRELVFVEGGAKINDETKEKLNFLNTTNSMLVQEEVPGRASRLNTISEAMNSTGSLLCDLSYSRSEDDLDPAELICGKWRKHRPSLPSDDHQPSAKKRRSQVKEKTIELDRTDGAGDRVVATVTVSKEGPMKASARVETIPASILRTPHRTPMPSARPCDLDSSSEDSMASAAKRLLTPRSTPMSISRNERSPNVGGLYPFGMNNKVNTRAHGFCQKTIIYPESCGPCGRRMKFGKIALKCIHCRATCHQECREQVPLPCVPVGITPTKKGAPKTIADFAPPTAPMVPALIVHCVREVEARGLTEVGIYRVPGAERDVRSLKEKFLRGKGAPNLSNVDVHVICGTIKDFLRSLSSPIILQSQWHNFINAAQDPDEEVGRALMFQAIAELPQPNRDTLAYFIMHLQRVAECTECKMPISNLAKVFGPTIVGYSSMNPEPSVMLTETHKQVAVMEHLMSIPGDYWANFVNVDAGLVSNTPSEAYLTPSTECLLPGGSSTKYLHSPVPREERLRLVGDRFSKIGFHNLSFRRRVNHYFPKISPRY